jgi:RNA-binding protein
MATLKGSARTYLRGLAHHLKPVAFLGKNGVTPEFIENLNHELDVHELIKLKFISHKEQRKILAKEIEAQTHSELLGLIGNIAILYREQHDQDKRTIQIPEELR